MIIPGIDLGFSQLILLGWLAAVPGIAKFGLGLFGGLKSMFGGPSREEKLAYKQLSAQTDWANQDRRRALGWQNEASDRANAIWRGDISRVPLAQKAANAYEQNRQSMMNLMPRSGGASAGWDPYGKHAAAWGEMRSLLPSAMEMPYNLASQSLQSMSSLSNAPRSILDWSRQRAQSQTEAGGGFYDFLNSSSTRLVPGLASVNRIKKAV